MEPIDRDRRNYISVIPEDLRVFQEEDVDKVFNYLQKTFHLHKDWQKEFRKELMTIQRGRPVEEFFFDFALRNLDPPLKKILRRRDSVILALVRYLIRDKIAERRQQASTSRTRYRR